MLRSIIRVSREICKQRRTVVRYCTVGNTADDGIKESALLTQLAVKYEQNMPAIRDLIDNNTELEKITHVSQWDECFTAFRQFGYSFEEIIRMLSKYPSLLSIRNIHANLERWYHLNINSDFVHLIFTHRPELLEVPILNINKRLPYLVYLARTDKNLARLLVNCPNVLIENWSDIMAKIEYIEKEMRIDKEEVVKCITLSKSLIHIKTRHKLLERAGLYVKPPLHKRKEKKMKQKNPDLKRMFDSEDKSFCKRVARISLEELEVFQELYKIELAHIEEEMELNSDSDTDTDDE